MIVKINVITSIICHSWLKPHLRSHPYLKTVIGTREYCYYYGRTQALHPRLPDQDQQDNCTSEEAAGTVSAVSHAAKAKLMVPSFKRRIRILPVSKACSQAADGHDRRDHHSSETNHVFSDGNVQGAAAAEGRRTEEEQEQAAGDPAQAQLCWVLHAVHAVLRLLSAIKMRSCSQKQPISLLCC